MKVLIADLPGVIQKTIEAIRLGLYNENAAGLTLLMPSTINFENVEVVTKSAYNTITRTATVTPQANRVSTVVDEAYSETTTMTPATTQTDDTTLGGDDVTNVTRTYTEYSE